MVYVIYTYTIYKQKLISFYFIYKQIKYGKNLGLEHVSYKFI